MPDKTSPEYWEQLKPGSIVTLSDEQAIKESMEAGNGPRGIDYTTKSVITVKEMDGLAQWLLFELEGTDQDLWLMAKIVDQDIALRVYYEPEEFEVGDRGDALDRGDYWLFQEPEDPDNFEPTDLSYTTEIQQSMETQAGERDVIFRRKSQGEMHGTCSCEPKMAGIDEMFATVVEYSGPEDYENPEVLLLETGKQDNPNGGCIRLMLGADITPADVDILEA